MLSQAPNAASPHTPQPDRRRDLQRRESERRRTPKVRQRESLWQSDDILRNCQAPPMLAPVSSNTPGQSTPLSAAAQVNVPVAAMHRSGHNPSPQHPYAAGGFEYPRGEAAEDAYNSQQPYGRASPMMSAAAPPAVSQVRARAGDVGMSHDRTAQGGEPPEKSTLWKILTCNCG